MTPERWRQIEELYHAALEREPESRNTFLAEACGSDSDLLGEVACLIAQPTGTELLDTETLGHTTVEPKGLAESLTTGQRLGPYRIVGPLGEGGMGKVYRARDTRLDRDVAIKISTERFSQRFEREARAISALNHPNICTLHDVGSLPSGASYMVTELVEGETLRDWLKRTPAGASANLDRRIEIARQVLEALRAAHGAGIVHRDLKPGHCQLERTRNN